MKLQKAVLEDLEELVHMNIGLRLDEKYDDYMTEREVRDRMLSFLTQSEYRVFLIIDEESTAGYCVVNILLKPMYLRQLYVKEKFRNKGMGTQAITQLLELLGSNELDIEVMCWNDNAIKFYEKYGFEKRYIGMRYKNA